jgi:hypothetical protein
LAAAATGDFFFAVHIWDENERAPFAWVSSAKSPTKSQKRTNIPSKARTKFHLHDGRNIFISSTWSVRNCKSLEISSAYTVNI